MSCLTSELHLFHVCTGVSQIRKCVHVKLDLEFGRGLVKKHTFLSITLLNKEFYLIFDHEINDFFRNSALEKYVLLLLMISFFGH